MRLLPVLLGAVLVVGCGPTTTVTVTRVVARPPVLVTPPGGGERDRLNVNGRPASGCGVERWAVKTLTDPGANAVRLTPVVPSTVGRLAAIKAPLSPTDRVAPTETTVFWVHGTLTTAIRESDSDYHLVVQDGAARMIVELSSPSCAKGSLVLAQITAARSAFEARVGVPRSYPAKPLHPNVPVTVEGPGFFDRIHGQTGVAKNGLELHPLTKITFP